VSDKLKKIIVLQHIELEGLALLEKLLIRNKCKIDIVKLFRKEEVPLNLKIYDMMIVLGGPMDVWMTKSYPWLKKEKEIIKKFAIDMEKPFIGICLGCQLLGEVLDFKINKSIKPEIGFYDVSLTEESNTDKLFKNFPKKFKAFHWHNNEVANIRNCSKIKVLGSSKITNGQIFRYKNNAYGIQFHLEIEKNTINSWLLNKNYKDGLLRIYGKSKINELKEEQKKYLKKMQILCEIFFKNLLNSLL
tara:strand:- start:58 stop:795 length:738 start_codon:yes stop_codon:yes gene_type:complete